MAHEGEWSKMLGLTVEEVYQTIDGAVRTILRDATDDERREVAQQTWLGVLVALRRRPQVIVYPRRWLYRAAENTSTNLRFRSSDALGRARWEQLDDETVWRHGQAIARPDSIVLRRELAELIIDRLSERQRFICCRAAWGDSGQDIARQLGRTPPIVTRELKRVRTLIRDQLERSGEARGLDDGGARTRLG